MASQASKTLSEMMRPLSDREIIEFFNGKVKILKYNDLRAFQNVDQLLAPYGRVIILYEWANNMGHWVGLFKRGPRFIEFFDPYGYKPDDEKKYIPANFWERGWLSQLLYNASRNGYTVEYNEYPFQTKNVSAVSTCGRWVALREKLSRLSLQQFASLFLQDKQILNDIVVTTLTSRYF